MNTEKILDFILFLIMVICVVVYFLYKIIVILICSIPLIIMLYVCWYGIGKFFTLSMIFIILLQTLAVVTDIGKPDDII